MKSRLKHKLIVLSSGIFAFCSIVHAQETATDFQLPIDDYSSIGQRFGSVNPSYGGKRHVADDVSGQAGITTVVATANGKVMFAKRWGNCPNWGYVLVIEHILPNGNKINSIYGHLDPSTVLVAEGQDVTIGQPIGKIGHWTNPTNGDACWGDHLHFGLRFGEFGQSVGTYPIWLVGYLSQTEFRQTYCEPLTFIRDRRCAFFDFALDRFEVDGNIDESGNPDGMPEFADDFNDGSLTTPPTSFFAFSQGTSATNESGGFLNLRSRDGAFVLGTFFADDAVFSHLVRDGAGNSVVTVSFRADTAAIGQFYGLGMAGRLNSSVDNIRMFLTRSPNGVIIIAVDETNQNIGNFPVDPGSAVGNRIFLKLTLNDALNQVTPSFSLDGGFTFISFPQSDIFNTDSEFSIFVQGTDRISQ